MESLRVQSLFYIVIIFGVVLKNVGTSAIILEEGNDQKQNSVFPYPPGSDDFKKWLELQGEKTVQKIMDKIISPNDTLQQYEAKAAVARFLVNVTFATMTRRLNLGKSVDFPETALIPESFESSNETMIEAMLEVQFQNETNNDTTTEPVREEFLLVLGGGNITSLDEAIPASAPFNGTNNMTEATTESRPIWQELLTFNFSQAFSGGGGAGLLNLSRLTNREGGGNSLFNLSRLTGSQGGSSLFNLSRFSGGEGASSLFNLSRFSGNGASNLFNLSRFSSGDGPGFSSLFNISSGDGGFFNFSLSPSSGGGEASGSSAMSNGPNEDVGGIPFVLPTPPEGFLNFPTPPPMNDSVRMSQMYLGNQVEKLVGDINQSNLTGIVDSTINIATPSTVGVLVNALLNIVLCNPLDRWNGNCGV